MLLLEIAAHGVQGVSPAGGSARLRPGYNALASDGAALLRLVEALLQPRRDDVAALRALAANAGARAGLTLLGDDGLTWRVVRDLGGGCALHRFDPARRAFVPASQEPEAVASQLAAVGAPPRGALAARFTVSAAGLPSRSGAPARQAGAVASDASSAAAPAAGPAPRAADLAPAGRSFAPGAPPATAGPEARLGALRAELFRARRAEELQFRLDGLQTRLFQLEEAAREGERLRAELAAAEEALAKLAAAEPVWRRVGGAAAVLEAEGAAAARRDAELAAAAEERRGVERAEAPFLRPPFWRDPRFWAGAGAGGAALAVGLGGAVAGSVGARYLALLDLPAFGYAAWIAIEWTRSVDARGRFAHRRQRVAERERRAVDGYERETAQLRDAAAALGAPGQKELGEALERYAAARAAAEEARARVEAARGRAGGAAGEEQARLQDELAGVEAALADTAGGWVRDPQAVEAEIHALEEALAAREAAPAEGGDGAAAAPGGAAARPGGATGGEEAGGEDATAAAPHAPAAGLTGAPAAREGPFVDLAAELSRDPGPARVPALLARATASLVKLSGGRLSSIAAAADGALEVTTAGVRRPAAELGRADADLAWLAVRLALLGDALGGGKRVAFVDDVFAGAGEAARRAGLALLGELARAGQIVHAVAPGPAAPERAR